jgi:hypothetical protein
MPVNRMFQVAITTETIVCGAWPGAESRSLVRTLTALTHEAPWNCSRPRSTGKSVLRDLRIHIDGN